MKNALVGFALALALFSSYQAYRWKKVADERGWKAEVVYAWMSQVLATHNHQQVTRAAVLDAIAKEVLKNGNAQKPQGEGPPAAR
jgi:hypothetical protein